MKKLFFIFFILNLCRLPAQLSGSALLNGSNNHSGIKVKFIVSASSTGATDSTLTDASGNYSINISGGVYNIIFSKNGYQSVYYNNNNPIVLANSSSLTPVTLLSGNVVVVNGIVSGNWTNSNIYVVNSDITIPAGSTLAIQPGTVIKFNGGYTLTANGALQSIGTAANPILFTSNNSQPVPGSWVGISINSTSSILQNCKIEYASKAIEILNSNPSILQNEIIRFLDFGIYLKNSTSLIKENTIHDFNTVWYSQGITSDNSNCTIECNTIFDGARSAIRPSSHSLVKNNLIHHILETSRGYGIDCGWNVTSRVENNIIHDCIVGVRIGENVTPVPTPTLVNNTIYSNAKGISMEDFYATPCIIGNIVTSNTLGIWQTSSNSATPSNVSYNLVWNNSQGNFSGVQILALGQMVNTNSNGDPIDSYFNLSQDPLFVNNTPPYYSSNSPCINAGKSSYSQNIGCDPSLMCIGMILGIKENKLALKYSAFPNPFTSYITITGIDKAKVKTAGFYDLGGKYYAAILNWDSESDVRIKKEDLEKGIYFLEITFVNASKEYLRVIKD